MSSHRTLLLVEDEEQVRKLLAGLLTTHGWLVTAAASGDEALARLAAFAFDIVLCDLDLGRGPNGLDVLARRPSKNEITPFVILTAHGSTHRCRDAFLRGATDFIEKPFRRAALLATLDHAVADAVDASELPIDAASTDDAPALPYDEAGAAHVRHAIQIMERRYAEFDLAVGDVAAEEGVSPDYLARLFKARLGHSPIDHLHDVRISRAEELMALSPNLSLYEIGYACGYKRTSKFGSWFRRLRGSAPSKFRTE